MISFDAIRTAVFSELPWTRLNEIVRAELAGGRTTKQVLAEFANFADRVWDLTGISEDGKDSFGDTLDALNGNCRSDQCYRDIPPALPTEIEPRRPLVPPTSGSPVEVSSRSNS